MILDFEDIELNYLFKMNNSLMRPSIGLKEADIRKRLEHSGITNQSEYQEIIVCLEDQKCRLEDDLMALKQKVKALQSKYQKKQHNNKVSMLKPQSKYMKLREQLSDKYIQLHALQKKSLKTINRIVLEAEHRAYMDQCLNIQREIQLQTKELKTLKLDYRRQKKQLNSQRKGNAQYHKPLQYYEEENKNLRKQIFQLALSGNEQMKNQILIQNQKYELKKKARKIKKIIKENSPQKDEAQIQKQALSFLYGPQQGERLLMDLLMFKKDKQQIYQMEGQLNRDKEKIRKHVEKIQSKIKNQFPNEALRGKREGSKLVFNKEIQILLSKNRIMMAKLNELDHQKIELILKFMEIQERKRIQSSRFNRESEDFVNSHFLKEQVFRSSKYGSSQINYGRKQQKLKSEIGIFTGSKAISKQKIFYEEDCQTQDQEYVDESPLRKQFIGIIGVNKFNDRTLLKEDKSSTIKALHIYYTDRGIAAVKAFYSLHHNSISYNTKVHLPESFIDNYCKIYKIEVTKDDFLRMIKVKYHRIQNKLISIKIISHKGVRFEFPDKNDKRKGSKQLDEEVDSEYPPAEDYYVFDINRNEYPVCIFGSYTQKGPYWYLSGFGVEVNDL